MRRVQVVAARVDGDERGEVLERHPHERLGPQVGPRDRLGGDDVRGEQRRGAPDGAEVHAAGLGEGGADGLGSCPLADRGDDAGAQQGGRGSVHALGGRGADRAHRSAGGSRRRAGVEERGALQSVRQLALGGQRPEQQLVTGVA